MIGPAPGTRRPLMGELAIVSAIVALSLWVYRSALGAYFSPDDLIYLERVRGIVPEPPTLWRYLSGVAYFQLAYPAFGAHAFPYMLTNWLLHGLAVASLYGFVRGAGGGRLAATLAAGLFGTSRLFLTVVLQVVTVAEPLSLILALAALWMARQAGRSWLWGAVLVFAAALLCKETVMLLPLLLLLPGQHPEGIGARAVRYAALMTPSLLLLAYLSSPAVQKGIFVDTTYARAFGVNLFHSLMTFTAWAVDYQTPIPDLYSILSTTAWQSTLWVMLWFAALAAFAWRTTRLPAMGLGWWLLTLAPVLPLLTQRYLHYLYVPMAGLTMALGSGLEWVASWPWAASPARARDRNTRKRPAERPLRSMRASHAIGWALAVALIVAQAWSSEVLIARRAGSRLTRVDLPVDPFLRKAETARRVVARVGEATSGRRTSVVFVIPESGGSEWLAGILHSILGEGRALRAVYANLDSVAFVRRWSSGYRDFEVFYGRVDGNVVDVGRGPDAHRRLFALMMADRCDADARADLATALDAYPDDPGLRALAAGSPASPSARGASTPP